MSEPLIIIRQYSSANSRFDPNPISCFCPSCSLPCVEFILSNGVFSGATSIYSDNGEELDEIGKMLEVFPVKVPDEYSYEFGSEDAMQFFKIKAYTIDGVGYCAMQFSIALNNTGPDKGKCCFSIGPFAPAELNKLGVLFRKFSTLEYRELRWPDEEGEGLYHEHQNIPAVF